MNDDSPQTLDDFLNLISMPSALFDGLRSIWGNWYLDDKKGRPKSDQILKELNNNGHCNILALAELAIEQGSSSFDIMSLLNPIIGDLTLHPSDLISLWRVLYEKTKNDMMSGTQFECLPNLVEKKPNLTGELLNLLTKADEVFTVSYMSAIRCELAKKDFDNQFIELIRMSKSESEYEVRASINALSWLNYLESRKSHITQVLVRFDELEEGASDDVLFALVHAHGALLEQRKSVSKKLVSFLLYDKAEIDFALSKILFLNRGDWQNEGWYKQVFQTLSRTLVENKGTLDNLDFVASDYMKQPNGFSIVEEFVLNWLEKSGYTDGKFRFEKIFDSIATDYVQNRDELEKFVTYLFNSDHPRDHNLAQEFVSLNALWRYEPVNFSKSMVKNLSMEDLIYLSRKMIGYVFQPQQAATFAYSILNKSPTDENTQGLVYELLANIIGPNYLRSTISFLKAEKNKTKAKSRLKLCDRIINKLESDVKKLKALPKLKECYVLQDKNYIAQLGHQKVMQKSMDEANESSIMSLIATTVSLKYGRGSFFTVKGEMTKPTPMIEHSTSMELPRSEVYHPVHSTMQRVSYRMAKRGQ